MDDVFTYNEDDCRAMFHVDQEVSRRLALGEGGGRGQSPIENGSGGEVGRKEWGKIGLRCAVSSHSISRQRMSCVIPQALSLWARARLLWEGRDPDEVEQSAEVVAGVHEDGGQQVVRDDQ